MMSSCARCGQNICTTSDKIALNKIWHKCCFSCCSCGRQLSVNSAKVYCGEIFCDCCYPSCQEFFPKNCYQPYRVNSVPSCVPPIVCYPKTMRRCDSGETVRCVTTRNIHSCSCIPACCQPRKTCYPRNSCQYEEIPQRTINCRPRSPKPCNYPPRNRSPANRCKCCKCCRPVSPPKRNCPPPYCSTSRYCPPKCPPQQICCEKRKCCGRSCEPDPCCVAPKSCGGGKKILFFEPNRRCEPAPCCYPCKCDCDNGCDRCRRCGEKVFAAEKIITSTGPYHLGCFCCYCCCKSLCIKTMYEACGEIYCKQCYNTYFGLNGYGY